jgi:hypothetical protein
VTLKHVTVPETGTPAALKETLPLGSAPDESLSAATSIFVKPAVGPPSVEPVTVTVSKLGAALEAALGKARAIPKTAAVRISFSVMVAPLRPGPRLAMVYHRGR